jgi:hypothetical protein
LPGGTYFWSREQLLFLGSKEKKLIVFFAHENAFSWLNNKGDDLTVIPFAVSHAF